MFVYSTDGEPVGFVFEMNIYDLTGAPLGRILGNRVHRFDGAYVGEWFCNMVVLRPQGRPRFIAPVPVPAPRAPEHPTFRQRAPLSYGYEDAFPALYEPTLMAAE
jgi:hypothetical protein